MRFNTDRATRLAFDKVADRYGARPDIPVGIFDWAATRTGLAPSQSILEVGAGAGQLTRRLLDAGAIVYAVEPGKELCETLRVQFPDTDLEVFDGFFEDCRPTRSIDAIWSANAFHWTDPDLAVPHACEILGGCGWIVLIWTFLILAEEDADLRTLIANGRLGGGHANFGGSDPSDFVRDFERSATEGRDQLTRADLFVDPAWEHQVQLLEYPAENYADLVLTFANAAALEAEKRERLHRSIQRDIVELDLSRVTFEHHAYAVAARSQPGVQR